MTHPLDSVNELQELLGIAAVIGVGAVAVTAGDRAQRLCGLTMWVDAFAVAALSALLPSLDRLPLIHIKALVVLGAYGAILARYGGGWLIFLTGLQGFAVLIHLSRWRDADIGASINGFVLNLVGWAMLIVLLTAVLSRGVRRA